MGSSQTHVTRDRQLSYPLLLQIPTSQLSWLQQPWSLQVTWFVQPWLHHHR